MTPDDIATAQAVVEGRLRERATLRASDRPSAVDRGADEQAADDALEEWLTQESMRRLHEGQRAPTAGEAAELRSAVRRRVFGLGELQELLEQDDVETIHVNGADSVFVRDADGRTRRVGPVAASDDELVAFVRRLAAGEGLSERRWDVSAPALNLTLRDGSRLHGLMAVTRRPCITIRRHRLLDVDFGDLVRMGTLHPAVADLLEAAILSGQNIVIAGGPSAGKSSLLKAAAACYSTAIRIVSIEDVLELHLDRDERRHPNCVAIQTRPPNLEGRGEVPVTTALVEALRMDPDVIVVGEVRVVETCAMLIALATGNGHSLAGSLSTVHAFSTAQAVEQLQTYAMVGPDRMPAESSARLIGSAVHWVVHLERRLDRSGSRRVVGSVREVCGSQGIHVRSNEVYRLHRDGRVDLFAGVSEETRERLLATGYDIADLVTAGRVAG